MLNISFYFVCLLCLVLFTFQNAIHRGRLAHRSHRKTFNIRIHGGGVVEWQVAWL